MGDLYLTKQLAMCPSSEHLFPLLSLSPIVAWPSWFLCYFSHFLSMPFPLTLYSQLHIQLESFSFRHPVYCREPSLYDYYPFWYVLPLKGADDQ